MTAARRKRIGREALSRVLARGMAGSVPKEVRAIGTLDLLSLLANEERVIAREREDEERRRRQAGARAATAARERQEKRTGWRQAAMALDAKQSQRKSRTRRAVDVADALESRGFKVSWRTVYDALKPQRPRRSR